VHKPDSFQSVFALFNHSIQKLQTGRHKREISYIQKLKQSIFILLNV